MAISVGSSNVIYLANTRKSAETLADFDISAPSGSVVSGTSPDTTAAPQARQNLPGGISDATTAALLALQETDAPTATPAVDAADANDATLRFQGQETTAKRLTGFKATPIAELPEAQYQDALGVMQQLLASDALNSDNMTPADPSYLANHPALKTYATVVVAGKVVATIDNQGVMSTSDDLSEKLKDKVPDDVNGTNGPDLAQARAAKIAALVGGTIVKASTAITQTQFNANPIDQAKLRPQVNPEAMKQDPMYAQIEALKAQRAVFLTQQALQATG